MDSAVLYFSPTPSSISRICSAGDPGAGTERYLSDPMTTGLVGSTERTSAISRRAIGTPEALVELGISFPIDHMITEGEFFDSFTISMMSASLHRSKKRA